jgi:serine O-acetyltransferase
MAILPDNGNTEKLTEVLVESYHSDSGINFIDVTNLPVRDKILQILDLLTELLFPGYTGKKNVTRDNVKFIVGDVLCQVRESLAEQVDLALRHQCRLDQCDGYDCKAMAGEVTDHLLNRLPAIREMLRGDVQAAFDGDPAAKSFEEIIISYPYITAIAIHRIAHELYLKEVPLIPRMMSESAHAKTGIDIHPGASIGRNFFIDHGTGVVIGETTIIGNSVKLYQGVTLGALSFPKDERGRVIKGGKRHPTIEDNVTIYAEATVLGDVTIGAEATVSGNVWLTHSVAPGVTVATVKPQSMYKHRKDSNQYYGRGSSI